MRLERSLSVRVSTCDAEKMRILLRELDVLRKDLKIKKGNNFVYFPIKDDSLVPSGYIVEETTFQSLPIRPKSYQELVHIPRSLKELLPISYDIVGSIILIRIPIELIIYKSEIGLALLKVHRHCTTVCCIDPVKGELRLRNIEVIAGLNSTVTVHREFGLWFKVDVAKVYFSGRLASERRRVAKLVGENEYVLDMFAGVGPFSIMMAREGCPKGVMAIDKNREAVELARYNVMRNNVDDVVEVVCGDAVNVKDILGPIKVDRIVMNLPFGGFRFFSNALSVANDNCAIHYYEVLSEDGLECRKMDLNESANSDGYLIKDMNVNRIKSYAPYEFYMCFDIVAQKCADVA